MATIKTTFSLQDDMSKGLNNINSKLDNIKTKLQKTSDGMLKFNIALQAFNILVNGLKSLSAPMEQNIALYQAQIENETKLETVMRQRMNASKEDIQYLKDLASAQQKVGIYGDEMILKGAQELATFATTKESVATLIPAMNNLVAQQYGYNASAEQMRNAATMIGKVLSGNVTGLQRLGYVFSEEEKKMIQNGNEMQRASVLAKILNDNVGEMNKALAQTPIGAIKQASNQIGDFKEEVGKALVSIKAMWVSVQRDILIRFQQPIMNAINMVKENLPQLISGFVYLGTVMSLVATVMAVTWAIANWQMTVVLVIIITITRAINDMGITIGQATDGVNTFSGSVAKAGNVFGKVAGFIFSLLRNGLNAVYNVFGTIYNAVANIFEVFENWRHPLVAFQMFFLNFATNILNILSSLSEPIDKIFKTKIQDNLNKASSYLERVKNQVTANTPDYKREGTMQYKEFWKWSEIGDWGNTSSTIGNIFDENISKISQWDNKTTELLGGINDALNGTLSVKDNSRISIADDYRELLSQSSLQEYQKGYVQNVKPVINMGGITVNKDADADSVIEKFFNELNESMETWLGN